MRVLLLIIGLLVCGFTKNETTYTTDGSQSDVSAAIADSTAGDTVTMPVGTNTWGTSASFVTINKAITLQGSGTNQQTHIVNANNGPTLTSAIIRITAAATVKDFSIEGDASGTTVTSFSATSPGWRITNIRYVSGAATGGYFLYATAYGLIDKCFIRGLSGSTELIFIRGPSDSWQTPSSMGTTNAVYVENCIFSGASYVCDVNDNGRAVFRYNLISGAMKIDLHGFASNSLRGGRHIEIYGNRWTSGANPWNTMEIRGGTGMIFQNLCDNRGGVSVNYPSMELKEYGVLNQWSNFTNVYQTPINYPIKDQIGVGMDPKVGGSEPFYVWTNTQAGVDYVLSWEDIPAAAIQTYTNQTGDTASTFTMRDIVQANRDYFKGTNEVAFTGTGGVGIGTAAAMAAITPVVDKVGFWVTDEANWNTEVEGADGQLYVWDGDSWNLNYTPLAYPHPLSTPSSGDSQPAATSTIGTLRAGTMRVGQ